MWAVSAAFRLLGSTGGKLIGLGLALFIWTAYQRMDATADCNSAQLQKELVAAKVALEKALAIKQAAEVREAASAAEIAELERAKNELLEHLNTAPRPQCILPDDVRDRLLRIR